MFESKSDVLDTYKTIARPSEGLYKEKGSKFISLAFPVLSETDIAPLLDPIKKEHYGARHHCFAWRLGFTGERTRAVDDGEPSSTAGRPILGQIVSAGLTNVLVVVVRYFGGTKLGVGGLIQAYKEAAADALGQAEIVEKTIDAGYDIAFPYLSVNEVMKIIKDVQPRVVSQRFDNDCAMRLAIRRDEEALLKARLEKVEGMKMTFAGYE